MGQMPSVFDGDRTKADDFIEHVKSYLRVNQDVAGFNSPIKKAALTLTLIEGPQVAGWKRDMGNWLDGLDFNQDNVPYIWEQFLEEFRTQFQDSQAQNRARLALETLKMKGNDIDGYIAQFEEYT